MKKAIFKKGLILYFLFHLFLPLISKSEIENNTKSYNYDLKSFIKDSEYILGPGDKLFLRFFGAMEFSGEVSILNDGTVSIPIIGDIYLTGITKKMAEEKIENLLSPHLIQKDVQVVVLNPRKIKVAIIGEVNKPGIYSINEEDSFYSNKQDFPFMPRTIKGVPTLIDAIQKSGGLTKKADISKIEIKRKGPSKDDFPREKLVFSNLVMLLKNGDFEQNPVLFDGDVITINKTSDNKNQPLKYMGNLTPNKIDVFVVGEVKNPGLVQINSRSSISKAILAAGGPINIRSKKNKIKIVRENKFGDFSLEEYNYNLKDKSKVLDISLNNGDVIFVDSTNLIKTTDFIISTTKPFIGLYRTLQFIKLLNNDD